MEEENIKSWISQQPGIVFSSNLKLSSGDQTKIICFEWRQHPIEDNLKMLKVDYLSNYWSDLPQILNYVTYEFLGGS